LHLTRFDQLIQKHTSVKHGLPGVILSILLPVFPGIVPICAQCTEFYGVTTVGGSADLGTIFRTDGNGDNLETVYNFTGPQMGHDPYILFRAANDRIYGITETGGNGTGSVLFEWVPEPGICIIKFGFTGPEDGEKPSGPPVQAGNGRYYGMTRSGGLFDCGVIYECSEELDSCTKVFDFPGGEAGCSPRGSLAVASSGKLYGVTNKGGTEDKGTLFEWDPNTGTHSVIHSFGPETGDEPQGSLEMADTSKFFGTTSTTLYEFDPVTGIVIELVNVYDELETNPNGSLVKANNGIFYGTGRKYVEIFVDGEYEYFDYGEIYGWSPDSGLFEVRSNIHYNYERPPKELVMGDNGLLYGMTEKFHLAEYPKYPGHLIEFDPETNLFEEKSEFEYHGWDYYDRGALVQAANGKWYGSAIDINHRMSDLFEYDPDLDTLKNVHLFTDTDNQYFPRGSLFQADDGILYGMDYNGSGILYSFDPVTKHYTLRHHTKILNISSLVQANNRNLYGARLGSDYLIEWDISKDSSVLKENVNQLDDLFTDSNGTLYGVDTNGGLNGDGALFEWDPDTDIYSKKLDFEASESGNSPISPLVQAENGKFYGMCRGGGTFNHGVLFEWDPATGIYRKIHDLDGFGYDSYPASPLTQAGNGKLYGFTSNGGIDKTNVLLELDAVTDSLVIKHEIQGRNHYNSFSTLLPASNGNVYWMSQTGGNLQHGAIYEFDIENDTFCITSSFKIDSTGGYPSGHLIEIPVSSPEPAVIDTVVCDKLLSPGGQHTWTESGTFTESVPLYQGCDSVYIVHLTVQSSPPFATDAIACEGESIPILEATGDSIRWYSDYEKTHLHQLGDTLFPGEYGPGEYHFYATQTISGCESVPIPTTLTILPKPLSPVTSDTTVCENDLIPGLLASGESIRWYGDPDLSEFLFAGNIYYPDPISAGVFTFYATQTQNGCEGLASATTLEVRPIPEADLGKDTILVDDEIHILGPFPSKYNYTWNDGSDKPYLIVFGNELSEGIHLFSVNVFNQGCFFSDTLEITAVKTVGSRDPSAGHMITIYPNPTGDAFNIRFDREIPDDILINIYNSGGLLVERRFREDMGTGNPSTFSIPLKNPGIYYITISGTGIHFSQSIIRL